jgi:hypothetical protein
LNIYRQCQRLFSGVNNTGEKFSAGVESLSREITKKPKNCSRDNDTADKLFGGVNDTGD